MQVGQPQQVRLALRLMPRLDVTGQMLFHTLGSRPFLQPTTGRTTDSFDGRQGREFTLDGLFEVGIRHKRIRRLNRRERGHVASESSLLARIIPSA